MMKPDEFLSSIYLGDRACKAVVLDGWKGEVKIQMNAVSRLRGASGTMRKTSTMAFWCSKGSITFPSTRLVAC
ncbi:DUF6258 family protein [Ensifer adhaerens]|uniref:DUF6258 family protein n=1 Tax=Ensifer adhaerens TaxID=106592 RepID=UPI003D040CAE